MKLWSIGLGLALAACGTHDGSTTMRDGGDATVFDAAADGRRPDADVPDTSLIADAAPGPDAGANAIVVENMLPGDPSFTDGVRPEAQLCDRTNSCVLEAYADKASVAVGETLTFHVSGQDRVGADVPYDVRIFRLGYYGGVGATRKASISVDAPATRRAIPAPDPDTGAVRAGWPASFTTTIGGADWTEATPHTGQYLAKLTVTAGPDAGYATFVPFVVRPDASRHAEILLVVPDVTWQVYNKWGGCNFYGCSLCPGTVSGASTPLDSSDDCPECCEPIGNLRHPGVAVSFDRPYATRTRSRTLPGTAHLAFWEYWTMRWLEREGYDVAYASGLDVNDAVLGDPAGLASRYDVLLSIGHDEYWTRGMRDHFEQARALGAHLVFLSGNTSAWQVRLEDDDRTVVGYKYLYFRDPLFATTSPDTTGPYRAFNPADICAVDPTIFPPCGAPPARLNRPESTLHGLMATDLAWPWGDATAPPAVFSHWTTRGLGLAAGDDVIAEQLFGHEMMVDDPALRPTDGTWTALASDANLCNINPLAGPAHSATMVLWQPSSGGMVFNGGATQWGWFLEAPTGVSARNSCNGFKFQACGPSASAPSGQFGCSRMGAPDPSGSPTLPSTRVQQLTRNVLDCFTGRRMLDPSCR